MMSDALTILAPLLLLIAGAFLLAARSEWVSDIFWPWRIAIGQTLKDGSPAASHPDLIRSRWAELLGPIPEPAAHAGFLDVPPNLARFGTGEDWDKSAEAFETARQEFVAKLDALIRRCDLLKATTWSDEVLHRLAHVRAGAESLKRSVTGVTAATWKSLRLPDGPYP